MGSALHGSEPIRTASCATRLARRSTNSVQHYYDLTAPPSQARIETAQAGAIIDSVAQYADRILPVDGRAADIWGRMNVPDPLPAIDGLLGATALAHDLTLVTRNISDLARTGAHVFNPFEPRGRRTGSLR